MSRSRRKPYYKDRGLTTHEYWSIVRHEWKQTLNENYQNDSFHLRSPKSILNDWDYSDYHFFVSVTKKDFWSHRGWSEDDVKKWSRK